MTTQEFLSTEGLAAYLDVPLDTVRDWRYRGSGPPGIRLGRRVKYRVRDVEAWLAERRRDQERLAGAR